MGRRKGRPTATRESVEPRERWQAVANPYRQAHDISAQGTRRKFPLVLAVAKVVVVVIAVKVIAAGVVVVVAVVVVLVVVPAKFCSLEYLMQLLKEVLSEINRLNSEYHSVSLFIKP